MADISEQINQILSEIKSSGDVEASIVLRRDGVVIASDVSNVSSKNLSVISSLISVSEATSIELKRGIFQEISIESENGRIVAVNAGKNAVLLSLVRKEGNLGFVIISLESAAKRIEKILGGI
ncbi:MAG: roadblock/LC7 domain-containing protein [Candidatus Micrarchaeota archaeon]|nr:roadblock/LC7 domain-containing protein [Candidatus Micrarchaeota archaeon]